MTKDEPFDFEWVMETYYHEIFHYMRKQVFEIETAKDLTQDVFMKVFTKKHTYNPKKASMRTWLYRIAHHTAMNFFKRAENKRNITVDPDKLVNQASDEDILETIIQHEDVSLILKLMKETLNKKHCRIMNLYFFSELSVDGIAKALDIPKKTVYNTINRSIEKIKTRLGV